MTGRGLAVWRCAACGEENTREHPGVMTGERREIGGHRVEVVPTCWKCATAWVTDQEILRARGLT